MRIGRSGWSRICSVVLLAAILAVSSTAAAAENAGDAEAARKKQADTLFSLKLFQGTELGYELDKPFTRAQGAVMLLRLFGWEQAAAVYTVDSTFPFQDVPAEHWAQRYIGFAYSKGLVRGVSDSGFAPDGLMTGTQFTALVLRALGYGETEPDSAAALAVSNGLLTDTDRSRLLETASFLRGDMVEVAYRAVSAKIRDSGKTLLQKLVEEDKAVDAAAAAASGLYAASAKPSDDPMDKIEQAIEDALKGK
ncbi:S-layer homology domain-containing protein [Paenibacillus chartarius]|uniref:S-layer homology domain-containing protein n=1 Tax=Paenibacillus chartarius TaxID=747481 RepID=A0ABV6DGP4_9BACL